MYVNAADMAYTRLEEPGPYVQHGVGNIAAARSDANAIHKEVWKIYVIDENTDATIKQDVIVTVDEN